MADLVEFLRARLDEDEQAARDAAADHPSWTYDPERFAVYSDGYPIASHRDGSPLTDVDGQHIARHDPARVLCEVEIKRRIIDRYVDLRDRCASAAQDYSDWLEGKRVREDRPSISQRDPVIRDELERMLRLFTLPHADHTDFKEEWSA